MNKLFFITVSVLLASVKAVDFIDCGAVKSINQLYVSCYTDPKDCELEAEKSYIFDVRFNAPYAADIIISSLDRVKVNETRKEPLALTYNNLPCPVEEGKDFIFYQVLSIPKDAPRERFQFIGRLKNQKEEELACYTVEIVYVDYKPSLL